MTFSACFLRLRRMLLASTMATALVCGGARVVEAASQPTQPVADRDPLVVRAIGAVDTERQLLDQQPRAGEPLLPQLRVELRAADDRGAGILDQLRRAGYPISASVESALGRLPRQDTTSTLNAPRLEVYQQAIDDLEIATRRPVGPTTAPTTAPTAGIAASPAESGSSGSSGSGGSDGIDVMDLLVVAVITLGVLVVVLVVLMGRRRADRRLAELAHCDSLTGLANRRRLDDDLQACRRDRRAPVAVMMVDVDNFKVVNDTHGHAAGDRILQAISTLLSREVRDKDVVYRYGGEEFCVLLPGASEDEALSVAERIRRSTVAMQVPVGGSVTVSVGVAVGVAADVMRTLGLADAALFDAKRDGRNRVVLAPGGVSQTVAPLAAGG